VDCERARTLIDAYLDRELAVETSAELERHLETCADCRARYEARRALSAGLQNPALRRAAPERLRRQVAAAISSQAASAPSRPARRQWLQLAAASVAAAALGSGTTYLSLTPGVAPGLADEVVSSHLRSLQIENRLVDVPSSSEHTVKPWFDGKVDFAPPVADLATDGFPLVGGRLDYADHRAVAALVYRHGQHIINLFVWPAGDSHTAGTTEEQRQGYNVVHWADGRMTYWAVSDLNAADLKAFGDLVQKQAAAGGTPE